MKITETKLGKHFGNLAKYRNIVEITLSPHELNPFKGLISHGIPNIIRRMRSQFFIVVPPFLVTYAVIDWCEAENARDSRKNPKDFENDK